MLDPKEPTDDPKFEQRLRSYLQQEVNAIDSATEARLTAMREEAVAVAAKAGRRGTATWVSTAAFATIAALAVALAFLPIDSEDQEPMLATPAAEPAALELVLLNEDFEIVEQDFAFYHWLALEETAAEG